MKNIGVARVQPIALILTLWHRVAMPTPISTLELRSDEIPRSPLLALIEKEMGYTITHERRHYLADQPVHCGNLLQFFENGRWITGRYEWSGVAGTQPSLHIARPDGERIISITSGCLLRWPK